MYLMFGDEADADQGRGQQFFVYGALFVDCENVRALSEDVESARTEAGYAPTDSLKFADSTRPADVTREKHRQLKATVLELAAEHGVVFCCYLMLHELARNQSQDELVTWGANTIVGKFNEFLGTDRDDVGLVLLDRLPVNRPYQYLVRKYQVGLEFPNGQTRRLERIVGFGSTCDGASNISSVADILVGSFRYCVNEPDRQIAGRAMFPAIVKLMWKRELNGRKYLRNYGFVLRPREVSEPRLQGQYEELRGRLQEYLT